MDADALETFLAIHREGGFSPAARELGRTQPAISQRIALLEQELGVKLFERGAGGLKLSQAGQVLLPYAERAMAALRDAKSAVRALAIDQTGPVALAVVGTLASTALTTTLRGFLREFPSVDLSLRTATSAEVSDLVRGGEATIGLRYFEDRSSDLSSTPLYREELVVVCAPDHRFARRRVANLAQLKDETWLDYPAMPGRREASPQSVLVHFRARGVGEVRWTPVDSLTAQKRLVETGFGVALLPESGVREELRAKTLALIRVGDFDASNPVVAVTRKGGFLSAAASRLLEVLGQQAKRQAR
jgi:DNA-binding transcriptional LysR family regulator